MGQKTYKNRKQKIWRKKYVKKNHDSHTMGPIGELFNKKMEKSKNESETKFQGRKYP